ncbi:MAG TPA: DUF4202 domain-containing protein [Acidimicrobiia bacterium]|nr:DUF4202 domain-containing protein [Acidimicrobiia bacterium]
MTAERRRFETAIEAIDAANRDDPVRIEVRGERRPKELAHAELATEWVHRLVDDPSEELLLAARAHHVRRWTLPRSSYPEGRSGYLKWRKRLHEVHAEIVGGILDGAGYPPPAVERVQDLVRKKGLAAGDPEAQALEDALCLVFVETQFHDVAARLGDDKTVEVVKKTLRKMSARAQSLALGLPLTPADAALVERALADLDAESA